jgi:NO-binding membrane sensor protein with MHYT domain
MGVAHEPWLVVLSLVVAMQGAYVGLSLAVQVGEAAGLRRRLLLAAASVSLGVAIWAMHFVAMLAARLPFPVDYLVFPTLLSFLVCVIVVGIAVFAVSARPLPKTRLAAAAVFMGGGIATMHYIGMAALHRSAHMHHAPLMVAASVLVGMAASGLALWLSAGHRGRPPLLMSAAALGMATAGMHYTAMAGLRIFPFEMHAMHDSGAPALSSDLLATVVAVVAFLVSGLFLLALVPERAGARLVAAVLPRPQAPVAPVPTAAAAPLVQVEGGHERLALHLPVERDGGTQLVPVEHVVAVHANAHYTYVFDGAMKLFCPLAIGDVEARLDPARFVRVHRSHIVALDRIVSLKRTGDHGVVERPGAGAQRCLSAAPATAGSGRASTG